MLRHASIGEPLHLQISNAPLSSPALGMRRHISAKACQNAQIASPLVPTHEPTFAFYTPCKSFQGVQALTIVQLTAPFDEESMAIFSQ